MKLAEINFNIKFLFIILFLSVPAGNVSANITPVASSTNYFIVQDAVSSGSSVSTSTNFSINDSIPVFSAENSTSTNFELKSGFLQMSSSFISITTPANVTMSPAINTSGGGVGNGSASWTITTDNSSGYTLSVKSATSPALKSSTDSFGDYATQVAGIPDYDFRQGNGADFFGFSPEGSDIISLYKDDGASACNTGSSDSADKCWDSFSTSDKTVSRRNSSNTPGGTQTTIKFRAEAGSAVHKAAGSYQATITITALAL